MKGDCRMHHAVTDRRHNNNNNLPLAPCRPLPPSLFFFPALRCFHQPFHSFHPRLLRRAWIPLQLALHRSLAEQGKEAFLAVAIARSPSGHLDKGFMPCIVVASNPSVRRG
ncbi:hypothetical protein MAP00_001293 [Monascus purpureus]|nr:hypothetical protein MAP00_001293 [Monascus purpureus]